MKLKDLKYGYYKNYDDGDGSLYDYHTAYITAKKHYTIFYEGSHNYYDILDENKSYKKDAKYGETLVTIEQELLDILPSCIDCSRDYTLGEILPLLPKILLENLSLEKTREKKKSPITL